MSIANTVKKVYENGNEKQTLIEKCMKRGMGTAVHCTVHSVHCTLDSIKKGGLVLSSKQMHDIIVKAILYLINLHLHIF